MHVEYDLRVHAGSDVSRLLPPPSASILALLRQADEMMPL